MESPRLEEESYFWARRRENGWDPLPEAFLKKKEAILKEDRENGMRYTFMGVPIEELTERETKAALLFLLGVFM